MKHSCRFTSCCGTPKHRLNHCSQAEVGMQGVMTLRSCACMQKGCSITRTEAFKSSVRGRPSTSRHTLIRLRHGPAAACRMTTADQVPPVQQQAAEHRQHVLAKFRQPGLIVIQVAEGKSATRSNCKASANNFCHIPLRLLLMSLYRAKQI